VKEHGSFNMYIINQCIVVEALGAWNIETALRFGKEYQSLVSQIEYQQWACLVDFTRFELAVPEVWKHLDIINEWGNQHNQKYEVLVCSSLTQVTLMEKSHEILSNVETKFCETLIEAKVWLIRLGVIKI
jgi:hypothetical protein